MERQLVQEEKFVTVLQVDKVLALAGTAVMTSYSRLEENRPWENGMVERKWLYQNPMDILIKASNGASDFETNSDNH
jgi:hypothetical protein